MECRKSKSSSLYVTVTTETFDLADNALRGTLPSEVAGLPNLHTLRFINNRLSGTVPEEILASGTVRCVDLSSNQMDNDIPQGECHPDVPIGDLLVVCYEEDDQACSCCSCFRETELDCVVPFFG